MVFPSVVKAGIGVGGEYGEGALRIGGKTVDYYNTASASIGSARRTIQVGRSPLYERRCFVEIQKQRGLESRGGRIGGLIKVGAGGAVDSTNIHDPIIGFVFGQKGLMYNLTLEGSKMTKIKK